MKKLITIVFLALIANVTFSQSTIPGNVRPLTVAYLGWDGTGVNTGSLEIKNNFAQPINFSTGGFQQMTILGSGNVGFVGIGKNFTSPASLLSVDGTLNPTGEVFRTNCLSSTTTIWRMLKAGSEYGSLFSGTDNNFYKKKTILRSFC